MNKSDNSVLDAKVLRLDAGISTFTAAELQAMEFPPIAWTVPGYLCEGLTILAGKPKLGKSWLALDWALAVAYGGMACGSIQCDPGDVLYAALEDNQRRLKRRMAQLLPDAQWPDRLELLTEMQRLNAGGVDTLRNWAQVAERPRLAVIDTLACVRPLRTGKENSYDSDYAALTGLQAFAGETGIAVLIVHHVRKMDSDDPLDTVSGTTGLTGAADTVLVLNRDAQGVVLYGRGRDVDEIESAMQFDKTTGRWAVLGNADEVRRSDERKVIADVLTDNFEPMTPSEVADALGQPVNNVKQLLYKMARDGQLERAGRGKYAPLKPPHNNDNPITNGPSYA